MSQVIESFAPDHRPALERMLEAEGMLGKDARFQDFWLDALGAPFRQNLEFLIARSADGVEGLVFASRRAYGRDGARLAFGWVAKDHRRRGVGTALKKGLDARLAARGIPRQITSLDEGKDTARPFLEAVGFTEDAVDFVMESAGKPYSYKPVEGIRCAFYSGGDPRLNDSIADLQNRAFVSETMGPVLTGEEVEDILTTGDSRMIVAIEEATGEAVGVSECSNSGFFGGIAVARRYWGTGLADWVVGLSLDRYREADITKLWSLVRQKNRASLALHERAGWRQVGTRAFFSAPTAAP